LSICVECIIPNEDLTSSYNYKVYVNFDRKHLILLYLRYQLLW